MYGLKEGENTILSRQTWQGLTETVTAEQNLKQVKECAVWISGGGKGFPGRGNRKGKGTQKEDVTVVSLKLPWLLVIT